MRPAALRRVAGCKHGRDTVAPCVTHVSVFVMGLIATADGLAPVATVVGALGGAVYHGHIGAAAVGDVDLVGLGVRSDGCRTVRRAAVEPVMPSLKSTA